MCHFTMHAIIYASSDAIFPSLPRWYTDPLRARSRSLSTTGSVPARISYTGSPQASSHRHEHELLEMLYEDVWTTRFINAYPTSILPGYFGAFFSRVLSPPVVQYQSPPFAPFAPLTPTRESTIPPVPRAIPHPPNGTGLSIPLRSGAPPDSPHTETFSNGGSLRTSPSSTLRLSSEEVEKCDISPSSSVTSLPHIDAPERPPSPRDPEAVSMLSTTSQAGSYSSGSTSSRSVKRPSVMLEGTSLGGEQAIDIFPVEKVQSQDEQTKYMHLYRTVTWVLSTKEAMWDELLVRVQAKDEILMKFGWAEEDYNEQASRARFESAIEQYQR